MKFSHIVPTRHLKELDEYSGQHLVLSHLIGTHKEYTTFFKESDKYKILDNGAYENGHPEPIGVLVRKAEIIDADEIILPDVFREMDDTMKQTEAALDYLRRHDLIKDRRWMGVAQGRGYEQYMKNLNWLLTVDEIDVIGLSFIIIDECFREVTHLKGIMPNRIFLTSILKEANRAGKEFHLLGMGNCKELQYQKKHDWIRGADSATAFVHGLFNEPFDPEQGLQRDRISEPNGYFGIKATKEQMKLIRRNMGMLNGFYQMY